MTSFRERRKSKSGLEQVSNIRRTPGSRKVLKSAQTAEFASVPECPILSIHETDTLSDNKFYLTVYSVGYGLSQCPVAFLNDQLWGINSPNPKIFTFRQYFSTQMIKWLSLIADYILCFTLVIFDQRFKAFGLKLRDIWEHGEIIGLRYTTVVYHCLYPDSYKPRCKKYLTE